MYFFQIGWSCHLHRSGSSLTISCRWREEGHYQSLVLLLLFECVSGLPSDPHPVPELAVTSIVVLGVGGLELLQFGQLIASIDENLLMERMS